MSNRPKIFGHLMTDVIRNGICVSCGSCEAACPIISIEIQEGTPKLVGLCIACGMCYGNCPATEFDVTGMENLVFSRVRKKDELEIGVHTAIYAVRAKEKEVLDRCQDGGAVSAILIHFLSEEGDGVVATGLKKGAVWVSNPVVASTKNSVLDCAGTKYTSSPTITGVSSAIKEHGKKKIAVVGTPCQIRGLRKLEKGSFSNTEIENVVDLKIGLFCMETFGYPSFMEFLRNEGVDASKVKKFEIKSGRFIAHVEGEDDYKVKLSRVKKSVRPCCHGCDDFSSEFSDISVGNVGTPDGWSTVIVRTKRGEKALNSAANSGFIEIMPIEKGSSETDIIFKLANKKKREARNDSFALTGAVTI